MAYSIGLTLYNIANRGGPTEQAIRPNRPAGPLVWLHAPSGESLPQMVGLARRLGVELGVNVVLTSPATAPMPTGTILQPPPHDSPSEARAFLTHWAPDLVVMSDGELRPALLHEAQERGIVQVLIDGRAPYIQRDRDGWWPGLVRSLLADFRAVLTVDDAATRAFRKAGAAPNTVSAVGRMEYPSAALPCNEAERAALARLLATRPVWFAASLPEAEEALVIAAHRSAQKLAHRLLLILSPQDPARAGPLAERMERIEGWIVARRAAEEEPDPEVQVYLTDSAAEFGLWYRLAPITYIGGTMSLEGAARDPMEAAALGSAIIHGPRGGRFGAAMGRLAAAQATMLVGSGFDLSEAVGDLLAPDRCARMAQAAWDTASDGAAATDRALGLIRSLLQRQG